MCLTWSCNKSDKNSDDNFKFLAEQFYDIKILRYQVPGFDSLTLQQKELVYYLSQAALCGRDIAWDQNCKYNLTIRRTLENIYQHYTGNRDSEDFKKFILYLKRVEFSNGIHHHYSSDKFVPDFTKEYFTELLKNTKDAVFPMLQGETLEQFIARLIPLIFDPGVFPKKVSQSSENDMIQNSAVNFYEGVTLQEAEDYYSKIIDKNNPEPISYGLNSKLVKEGGKVFEKIWKVGGMYSSAIEKIVYWLEKAAGVAENQKQKEVILKLIEYYKTGDLKKFDEFNVLWVTDLDSRVDFVNGFTEVYDDPLAMKGSWEAIVNFKNMEATKRTEIISKNAQWFEDHSPVDQQFKKKTVKGVSAKVITAAQLAGDAYPSTPIGINLPNADWIRKEHGSKSVTLENITHAYDQVSLSSGFMEEFAFSKEEIELNKKYGSIAGNLHTDLHECLGHGSGQMLPGVKSEDLKNYHSVLEESRADLFALYFIMDQKMVELGILPSLDAAKAEYSNYMRNGMMTQLARIELGKNVEQAHMRNRQLISSWCFEKGKKDNVIEKKTKDGKTYIVINDFGKLRSLFGELLKEVQRIKSEGDYEAGKKLVETYAIKVDPDLHKEVKERYAQLNIAPYSGFINPVFKPIMQGDKITDVIIEYPDDFLRQALDYSKEYSFLPDIN